MFSSQERLRYDRQIRLAQFGAEGQNRLKGSSVLIVGAGGLGTPAALYLAAAGVGRIGIVDYDAIDLSNLHRQVLYTEADVGAFKVEVLSDRLREVNPHIEVIPYPVSLTHENAIELVSEFDVVADGTDRFDSRYLVNDACVLAGRPYVFASVNQFDGQLSVFGLPGLPCYRCLFPQPPPEGLVPSCAEGGVLGVLPGLMGTLQATEVIKLLTNLGEPLAGTLMLVDALTMSFRSIAIEHAPECPICGDPPTRRSLEPSTPICAPMSIPEITVHELRALATAGQRPLVVDVRQPEEYAVGNIEGVLIPLGELPHRMNELDAHREDTQIVMQCRSGGRSGKAAEFLYSQGFTNVVNLKGGILAWSAEIDPSVATDMPS